MDKMRYNRYGGFRREEGLPEFSEFGYGGAGFGGYGRSGKYGGWRSNYDYGRPMKHVYDVRGNVSPVNMISPTFHGPTFLFAVFLVAVLILGLWFGKANNRYGLGFSGFSGFSGGSGSSLEYYL